MAMHPSRKLTSMHTNTIHWIDDDYNRAQRPMRNILNCKWIVNLSVLNWQCRRIKFRFSAVFCRFYGTLPTPVKSAMPAYSNNPGKIENFTPGHSSVSDKERKEVNMICFWVLILAMRSHGNFKLWETFVAA